MSDTNQLFSKANLARTGDLSFVGRFHHNFGFEDELFEYLLNQKDMWGEKLFYVNERQFSKWVEQGKHKVREVPSLSDEEDIALPETELLTQQQFEDSFGTIDPIDLNITKGGHAAQHRLSLGACVSLKSAIDRNGLALNVGGYVTAMKWLHYSPISVLAVFVINNRDGLASLVSAPELSVFPKPKRQEQPKKIRSAVQIWNYDVELMSLTLSQVLDTLAFGVTLRLAWRPSKSNSGNTGMLLALFTDGKLHFFKVRVEGGQGTSYCKVTRPSWTVLLENERKGQAGCVPLTAFDYVDHQRVVVGTIDGSVAEFVLPGPDTSKDSARVPSFVASITDSMITSVCVADVHASRIMLVNTATAQSYAVQYDQVRQGRLEIGTTVLTLQPLYHRTYRIFVYPDSAESIGYTFARHPHQKHSLLLRTELISTFHISEYLNHPFAVVGNTCGDFYVMNIGRKIFGMPKAHNKLVVPLKIWTLFRSPGEDGLTLSGDYIPVTPDRNEVMCTFTPPDVVISAAAWNENFEGSSTYAFGTYSGLLVLERLDPVLI